MWSMRPSSLPNQMKVLPPVALAPCPVAACSASVVSVWGASTEDEAGGLVLLLREMREGDVEKCHVRMLQLEAFFPDGK